MKTKNNDEKNDKLYVFLKIVLAVALAFLIYMVYEYVDDYYYEYLDLKESVANYQQIVVDKNKKITELNGELGKYKNQIEFMDKYVAICPTDGKGLYHKYNCTQYDHSCSFYIYNIGNAEQENFYPCPYCFGETSNTSDTKTEIVYITNTGSKYHRAGCSYLKSKKAITKEQAISQGYSPCSRCNP